MPVFVLALTNPAFYLPAIMKTVTLGQQASSTNARSAGRELVGSTLMGAFMAAVVWFGLTLRPNLWMLMLWMVAAALWAGARLFGVKATSFPPSFWSNALVTMLILLGPAIEDTANGKDVYKASAIRVSLFVAVALLRVGDGVGARALACLESQSTGLQAQLNEESHHADEPDDRAADHAAVPGVAGGRHVLERPVLHAAIRPMAGRGLFAHLRPLLVVMIVMMLGNFVQIVIWGVLVPLPGRVQRVVRGGLPFGSELHLAGLRRRRDERAMEADGAPRSCEWSPDVRHDERGADGDPAAVDQGGIGNTVCARCLNSARGRHPQFMRR